MIRFQNIIAIAATVLSFAACGSSAVTGDMASGKDGGDMAQGATSGADMTSATDGSAGAFNDKAFSSGGMGCGYQEGIGCPQGTYSYNCITNKSATPPEGTCTTMMVGGAPIYCCPDPLCTRFPAGDNISCGPANGRPAYSWTCPKAANPGGDCTPDGTGVYCCSKM